MNTKLHAVSDADPSKAATTMPTPAQSAANGGFMKISWGEEAKPYFS